MVPHRRNLLSSAPLRSAPPIKCAPNPRLFRALCEARPFRHQSCLHSPPARFAETIHCFVLGTVQYISISFTLRVCRRSYTFVFMISDDCYPFEQLPPHVMHRGPKPQPRVLYVSVPPPPAANAYTAADVARQSYRAGDRYGQNYRSSASAPAPAPVPTTSVDGAADPNRQQSYRIDGEGANSKRGSFSRESSLKRGRSRSSDRAPLSSGGHTVHFIGVPPSTISNRSSAGMSIGVRPHPAFAIGTGFYKFYCFICTLKCTLLK